MSDRSIYDYTVGRIARLLHNDIMRAEVEFDITVWTQIDDDGSCDVYAGDNGCMGTPDEETYSGPLLITEEDMIERIMPLLENELFNQPRSGYDSLENMINDHTHHGIQIDEGIPITQSEAPDAVNPSVSVFIRFNHVEFDRDKFGPLVVSHDAFRSRQ